MQPPKPRRDDEYRRDLLGYFQRAIDRHERGHQVELGPSEIGGCPRGIAWKLAYGAADGQPGGWSAAKGTVLHAWSDKEVFGPEERFLSDLALPQSVPWVKGGTLDLYDTWTKRIIDLKFFGDASHSKTQGGNPPMTAYVQIQTYALGAIKMGLEVREVGLLVPPMAGNDLHSVGKGAVLLLWPVDLQVAVDHLKAVQRISLALETSDPNTVMAALPTSNDYCTSRVCWSGNKDPRAICRGHREGTALPVVDPTNPFS